MVQIRAAHCSDYDYAGLVNQYRYLLTEAVIDKARAFLHKEDACRYIAGKVLLIVSLTEAGYPLITLDQLQFNAFQKPFFPGTFNFNISHSGNYVMCAFCDNCSIGIDVEEKRPIEMQYFRQCFTSREWQHIDEADDPIKAFYRFWTRKEAVIKADGRGVHIPLQIFDVIADHVTVDANTWYLQELQLDSKYSAHIATGMPVKDRLTIQYVF